MPDVATNEPVRLPHPPLLPPVLNLKEESHDRPHHDACHRYVYVTVAASALFGIPSALF